MKYKNLDITIEDVSVFVPAKELFKQTSSLLLSSIVIRMTTKELLCLGSISGV